MIGFELCLEISQGWKTEEKEKSACDNVSKVRKKEVTEINNRC